MFMVCQGSDCIVTQEVRKYEDVPSGPLGHGVRWYFVGTLTANVGEKHKDRVQTIRLPQWFDANESCIRRKS